MRVETYNTGWGVTEGCTQGKHDASGASAKTLDQAWDGERCGGVPFKMVFADREPKFLNSGSNTENLLPIFLNYLILRISLCSQGGVEETPRHHSPPKKDRTKNEFPASPGRWRTKPDLFALEK